MNILIGEAPPKIQGYSVFDTRYPGDLDATPGTFIISFNEMRRINEAGENERIIWNWNGMHHDYREVIKMYLRGLI